MKIVNITMDAVHVNHRGDWVFVHVLTDQGLTGIGELRAGNNYQPQVLAVRELQSELKGRDPRQIERIVSDFRSGNRNHIYALSAIEQALWDILGKSLQVPVHVLLGGPCREKIRLYANINRATTDRTPEGFARNAALAVKQGFDAIKLAPFDGLPSGIDSIDEAQIGISCMETVRAAIGPEIDLLVDCHSHFTVNGALAAADALRELDLFWFEQPIPEANLAACTKVKQRCGLRVAGAEGQAWRQSFTEILRHNSMDVIMPDVKIVGGIGELKKVADMASAWGIPTAPHGPSGPVTIAAGVEVMLSHPDFLILEYGWGEVDWRSQLTTPAEQIHRGRLSKHNRPGLGIELNQQVVAEHRVSLDF